MMGGSSILLLTYFDIFFFICKMNVSLRNPNPNTHPHTLQIMRVLSSTEQTYILLFIFPNSHLCSLLLLFAIFSCFVFDKLFCNSNDKTQNNFCSFAFILF